MYPTKKKLGWLVAVASVWLGAQAHAQSSMTLYGVVDGGLLYTSKTPDAKTGLNAGKNFSMVDSGSTPSVFGLRGTEDLGGGLKARFELESGIDMANGGFNDSNGNLFGREAWVSLASNYGEAKLGLQYSPFFLTLYESDPRGFAQFGSGLVTWLDELVATAAFNSNAISYTSPKIAGFEGSAMFALGGTAGDFQAGRQYSASLKYDNGGLAIHAALYDGNSGGTAALTPVPTTVEFEGRTLGVAYRFGGLTARALFVNYKVAGSFNDNVYSGGLDYYVLPQLDVNGGVWVTSDRNHTANHSLMIALGTKYFLSKATALYADVAVVNNHGAMNTGLSVAQPFGVAGTATGAEIGVRHAF